jgi:hypothetical protein
VVFLGIGDGTFQPGVGYNSGANDAIGIAVADINQDGKLDLAVANGCYDPDCPHGVAAVLLGNGDGTFQLAATYDSGGLSPMSIAVADLNGDGKPDLILANVCADGTCSGNGSVAVLINTSKAATTTTLRSSMNPSYVGQSVTFTVSVSHDGGGTPTGTVSFYDGMTPVADAALASTGRATWTTTTLAVGTHSLTASYNGDANFVASTSSILYQNEQKAVATMTLMPISPSTVDFGAKVAFAATVSSALGTPPDGEPVTFSDATTNTMLGTGPLSKGTATFSSTTIPPGSYSVVATYRGDNTFLGSQSSPQSLNVEDFKISANPSRVVIPAPGQSGSTRITITPYGGANPKSLSSWTCVGLPWQNRCVFGSVGTNDQISLEITTTVPSDPGIRASISPHPFYYTLLLPGFLGLVSLAGGKSGARRMKGLAARVLLGLLLACMGCNGFTSLPSPSTPSGTSASVVVSAKSGNLVPSTTITVTVE